jgi:hypothetical protein
LKKLIDYIKDFVRQDYNFAIYLSILLFLSIAIFLNYYFSFEKEIINRLDHNLFKFFIYLSLYCLAYYSVLGLYLMFKKINYFSTYQIMVKSFLALTVVALDRAFAISAEGVRLISDDNLPLAESEYMAKVFNLIVPWIFYWAIFLFLRKKYDRDSDSLYGLSFQRFDWKPYVYMLFCMIPLLLSASFASDFTAQYPFFKYWNYASAFGMNPSQLFSFYEIFYLSNFINIELLFRGALVIGMIQYMGKEAILPMVVTYAFIHFGKPCPETISSVFGGYILGVFAYRTGNIMGGIFIHISIAFLMDLFAILQRS